MKPQRLLFLVPLFLLQCRAVQGYFDVRPSLKLAPIVPLKQEVQPQPPAVRPWLLPTLGKLERQENQLEFQTDTLRLAGWQAQQLGADWLVVEREKPALRADDALALAEIASPAELEEEPLPRGKLVWLHGNSRTVLSGPQDDVDNFVLNPRLRRAWFRTRSFRLYEVEVAENATPRVLGSAAHLWLASEDGQVLVTSRGQGECASVELLELKGKGRSCSFKISHSASAVVGTNDGLLIEIQNGSLWLYRNGEKAATRMPGALTGDRILRHGGQPAIVRSLADGVQEILWFDGHTLQPGPKLQTTQTLEAAVKLADGRAAVLLTDDTNGSCVVDPTADLSQLVVLAAGTQVQTPQKLDVPADGLVQTLKNLTKQELPDARVTHAQVPRLDGLASDLAVVLVIPGAVTATTADTISQRLRAQLPCPPGLFARIAWPDAGLTRPLCQDWLHDHVRPRVALQREGKWTPPEPDDPCHSGLPSASTEKEDLF